MPNTVQVRLGDGVSAPAAFPADSRRLVAKAVRAALRHGSVRDAEISVALLDDAGITDMNDRFLGHAAVTDVISFALYGEGEPPVGDIYIGLEQALRQAAAHAIDPAEELVRLAVHGTLHVLGHDHPAGPDRTGSPMWRVQEEIVAGVVS
jgi:probable rRNA maturation factor